MLELLDTGRMAHKFGKWRGAVTAMFAVVPLALAWGFATVFDVVLSISAAGAKAGAPAAALWIALGLVVLAAAIVVYGAWLLYVDEVRGDYYDLAARYKREGW